MIENLKWDDFKVVLAIAEEKTLKKAATKLHFSHPTIYRRLAETETRCGVKLFHRDDSNAYVPTLAGLELVRSAKEIEKQVLYAERKIFSANEKFSGNLTITTTDTLMYGLLGDIIHDFNCKYTALDISVIVSNKLMSLEARDADIAFRPVVSPNETLIGKKILPINQAVYVSQESRFSDWLEKDIPWIAPNTEMQYPLLSEWFSKNNLLNNRLLKSNSILMDYFMVSNYDYAAVLPTYLENRGGIKRISPIIPELSTYMWGLMHTDLRTSQTVTEFLNYVRSCCKDLSG
ncbi:LysR family transcriptional regulator [Halomonas sp. SH5A2]|uniref:LysR family transcriptional regulator n=1 Tax=Halomonas sp. SH5A2 TaxID=2749040 RepID=UPI00163E39AF|nr:LysR family transcriptional regulator [Halomonas sp. SH5A2]QNI02140.1 LysR family transcriptional regulator [Halomonas sp. SH5A2]